MNSDKNQIQNFIQGTCLTMCSNSEIEMRLKQNLIHPLETKIDRNGQRLQYADCKKMVKEFSRSSAGREIKATDIRPLPILLRTVKYLCSTVCSSEDASWREIYDFVNDRLRAVRQDLVVQGLHNKQVVGILAPAVRFYLYSHYRLCELDTSEYDPYLNLQQLNETLLMILSIYKDDNYVDDEVKGIRRIRFPPINVQSRPDSQSSDQNNKTEEPNDECKENLNSNDESDSCPRSEKDSNTNFENGSNTDRKTSFHSDYYEQEDSDDSDSEASDENVINYTVFQEMVTLYLLINIGRPEVISCVIEMPKKVRDFPLIQRTIKASISWMLRNHIPLVHLTSDLTPVLASALHLQWNELQRFILGVSSVAFNSKMLTYIFDDLKRSLLFSSNESLQKACQYYGLSTPSEGVQFLKANFKWDCPVLKPEKSAWIEEKMKNCSIPDLLLS